MTDQPKQRQRASLNFGDFSPKSRPSTPVRIEREAAEAEGFTSRKSPSPSANTKIDGRSLRATGRSEQLNIAVKSETKTDFWVAAKGAGFSRGEEFLIALLNKWKDDE